MVLLNLYNGQYKYYNYCSKECFRLHRDNVMVNRKTNNYKYKEKTLSPVVFRHKTLPVALIEDVSSHRISFYTRKGNKKTEERLLARRKKERFSRYAIIN